MIPSDISLVDATFVPIRTLNDKTSNPWQFAVW